MTKRKAASPAGAAKTKKAATPKAKTSAAKGVGGLFEKYSEPASGGIDVIGPEGIESLCSDMGVSTSDRRVLLLAWRMGARKMGYFSREEFELGCAVLGATTLAALKKALPKLDAAIANPSNFQQFYTFAFRFCLTEPGQKIIDVETAAEMLSVVHPNGRFVAPFCEFLTTQSDYNKVNSDQWEAFLRFSAEVTPDLSNAEENPAWPVLLDNFVDWYRSRMRGES